MVRGFFTLAAACLGVVALGAQQPVFRAASHYVVVDVVVTDKDDRPVAGLTRDDFRIVESGRAQTIADFDVVTIPATTRPVTVDGEHGEVAPDVVSNPVPSRQSRLFALVVDDLHIIEANIVQVQRVMTDFIEALGPDDEVAIVFTGRSDKGVNVTSSRARLMAGVASVREVLGFGIDPMAGLNESLRHGRSAAVTLKSVITALEASAHPRRSVLFISAGSPFDPHADLRLKEQRNAAALLHSEWQELFTQSRRANVPIYSIDPRGLVDPADAVRGAPGDYIKIQRQVRIQNSHLVTVASNTGGRAFHSMSDLTRAVRETVAENGSYYVLGYYPDPVVRNGRFQSIRVSVVRDGLRVRARAGYVAPGPPGAKAAADALTTALTEGVNRTELPLSATVTPMAVVNGRTRALVTVEVRYPVHAINPIDDTLTMQATGLDGDGRLNGSSRREFAFRTTPRQPGVITLNVYDVIDLPEQPLTVRVGVASRVLGVAGTVQAPVTVLQPARGRLRAGGAIIGLEGVPPPPGLGADRLDGVTPFPPVISRTFTPADTLRLFVPLAWGQSQDDATVSVRLRGAAGPGQTVTARPGVGVTGASLALPLAGLSAGPYVVDVAVSTMAGGVVATQAILIRVQ